MNQLSPNSQPENASATSSQTPKRLRVVVDLNRCQGYAQCCFLAPDVFRLYGEEALIYYPEPTASQHTNILRAAAACPVQAITVQSCNRHKDESKTGHTDEQI